MAGLIIMTSATDADTGYAEHSAPVPLNTTHYEEDIDNVPKNSADSRSDSAQDSEGGAASEDGRDGSDVSNGNDDSTDVSADSEPVTEYMTFEATHYTAFCDTGCIGITRTGYDVSNTVYSPSGRRIVAVDPSVIPLHSILHVRMEDGTEFEAKALDTGGAIQGRIIDVLVSNTDEAWALGRQEAQVRIIRRGE